MPYEPLGRKHRLWSGWGRTRWSHTTLKCHTVYSNASLKRAFWIRMDPIAATWSSMGTISKRSRPCCPNTKAKWIASTSILHTTPATWTSSKTWISCPRNVRYGSSSRWRRWSEGLGLPVRLCPGNRREVVHELCGHLYFLLYDVVRVVIFNGSDGKHGLVLAAVDSSAPRQKLFDHLFGKGRTVMDSGG